MIFFEFHLDMRLLFLLFLTYPVMSLSIRKIRKVLDACFHQLADGFPFEFEKYVFFFYFQISKKDLALLEYRNFAILLKRP